MSLNWWGILHHFKPDSKVDKWGDPARMDANVLVKLDRLRHFIGHPIYVTSGFRGGDPNIHGQGRAVDVMCPGFPSCVFDLYLIAERFNFKGIGIYPHWHWNDKVIGGLHLDERQIPLKNQGFNFKGARWIGVKSDGINIYYPLDRKHLESFDIINKETSHGCCGGCSK